MKSISNSENQIAKRVNSIGNIYESDIEEIKKNQEEIYEGIRLTSRELHGSFFAMVKLFEWPAS